MEENKSMKNLNDNELDQVNGGKGDWIFDIGVPAPDAEGVVKIGALPKEVSLTAVDVSAGADVGGVSAAGVSAAGAGAAGAGAIEARVADINAAKLERARRL